MHTYLDQVEIRHTHLDQVEIRHTYLDQVEHVESARSIQDQEARRPAGLITHTHRVERTYTHAGLITHTHTCRPARLIMWKVKQVHVERARGTCSTLLNLSMRVAKQTGSARSVHAIWFVTGDLIRIQSHRMQVHSPIHANALHYQIKPNKNNFLHGIQFRLGHARWAPLTPSRAFTDLIEQFPTRHPVQARPCTLSSFHPKQGIHRSHLTIFYLASSSG